MDKTILGLKTFSEVIYNLNRLGVDDVAEATDSLTAKYNLIDLLSLGNQSNAVGHSVMIAQTGKNKYYYYDPIGCISKTALDKFIPDRSMILCNLDQHQKIGSEDCTAFTSREIILVKTKKLTLKNYVILTKHKGNYKIVKEETETLDKNKLASLNKIEDRLLNGK